MTEITADCAVAARPSAAELRGALLRVGACSEAAEIESLHLRPIGIGALADTFHVSMTWRGPGPGPTSLVAKMGSSDERAAATAASIGAYAREERFYRELAPRTDLSLPTYLGCVQPDGVLLEDLSELEPGDQLADVPLPTLRRLREQLVALQAPFWDDPDLSTADWLHRRLGVPIPGIVRRMQTSWRATRDHLASGFDDEERDLVDRFVAVAGEWAEALDGPCSLLHHDYRVDNVLLDPRDPERVVVLDWQTVGWGPPMFDVAYLMATSLSPATRRRVERDEVTRHVEQLAALGVAWSDDEAWTAYRRASFATLLMLVPSTGSVKRSERSDAMYRRLLRHGARMALDLNATEFLPVPA